MTSNAAVQTYRWDRHTYERMVEAGLFPPHSHAELINGKIVGRCPQGALHYTALALMEQALRDVFSAQALIRNQAPFVVNDESEPEPDLAVVSGSPRDYIDEHPHRALLLIEIADTTLQFDRTVKAALYAGCDIPEYWIVNLKERCVEVFRKPKNGRFTETRTFYPEDVIRPLQAQGSIIVKNILP